MVQTNKTAFPSVTTLLIQSWQFYRAHWKIFAPILILSTIPAIVSDIIAFMNRDALQQVNGGSYAQITMLYQQSPLLGFVLALLTIIGIIANTWATAAVLLTLKQIVSGEPAFEFEEAYKKSWPLIVGLFLTEFITGIIILGGFVLLIIPGFIFLTWGFAVSYVYIFEGKKYLQAFKRSRSLVLGNTVNVMLALGAVAFGIIAFSILLTPLPFIGPLLAKVITTPFATYYAYLLYKHLSQQKAT